MAENILSRLTVFLSSNLWWMDICSVYLQKFHLLNFSNRNPDGWVWLEQKGNWRAANPNTNSFKQNSHTESGWQLVLHGLGQAILVCRTTTQWMLPGPTACPDSAHSFSSGWGGGGGGHRSSSCTGQEKPRQQHHMHTYTTTVERTGTLTQHKQIVIFIHFTSSFKDRGWQDRLNGNDREFMTCSCSAWDSTV